MRSIVELRAEARRLREMIQNVADPALKQELAARALDLSIRAEEIARSHEAPEILRMNISRYRSMLAASTDDDQRKRIVRGDARPRDRQALIFARKSQEEVGGRSLAVAVVAHPKRDFRQSSCQKEADTRGDPNCSRTS
jgi:hypothetical protein